MDDYRKAAADSREWGRKARKAMKASVRMDLREELRDLVKEVDEPCGCDPETPGVFECRLGCRCPCHGKGRV
jgi:hypothetical protein